MTRATEDLDARLRAMVHDRRTRPADDLFNSLVALEQSGDASAPTNR